MQARLNTRIGLVTQPGAGTQLHLHFVWTLPDDDTQLVDRHSKMSSLLEREVLPARILHLDEERVMQACAHPAVNIQSSLIKYLLGPAGVKTTNKHRNGGTLLVIDCCY